MKKWIFAILVLPFTSLAQVYNNSGVDITSLFSLDTQYISEANFTQPDNATLLKNTIYDNDKFGRVVYANDRYDDDAQDVFLFDEPEFVNIYTIDGKGYKVPKANYNLVAQQLQVDLEDGRIFNFDISNIKYFENKGHKYILLPNVTKKIREVVSYTGKLVLLKGFELTKKPAMTNPLTNQVTEPAKYVKNPIYYIQLQNGDKFIELSQKERKFAKDFPDHNEEINEFLERSRLSVKNEVDLIRIVNYYNTL